MEAETQAPSGDVAWDTVTPGALYFPIFDR